ncbi:conserved exported hypothetical protein [Gammaproteobacteria bacterium]
MPKSTNTCNNFLALLYNATAWANVADNAASSPITTISVALSTVTGAVGDTMSTNEATYTNYLRVTVARTTGGWAVPASRATSNAAQITFAQCGASGNTITSAKTGKAAGASDVYHYGDLNAPISVSNLIQPVFAIGAMTITEA